MCALILFSLFAVMGNNALPGSQITEGHNDLRRPATRGSVVVVSEGGSGRQGRAADKVARQLQSALGCSHTVQVLRFDAGHARKDEVTIEGATADLLAVRPSLPMVDAILGGLDYLSTMPRPRTLIIITRDPYSAAIVSAGGFTDLARESGSTVYTIDTASKAEAGSLVKHLEQVGTGETRSLVVTSGQAQDGYPTGQTPRLSNCKPELLP